MKGGWWTLTIGHSSFIGPTQHGFVTRGVYRPWNADSLQATTTDGTPPQPSGGRLDDLEDPEVHRVKAIRTAMKYLSR